MSVVFVSDYTAALTFSSVDDCRRAMGLRVYEDIPGRPVVRNGILARLLNRIPFVRTVLAGSPMQRVFRDPPEDAVLAIDMTTKSVWIRGTSPDGWVPLDIPKSHLQAPSQFYPVEGGSK